VMLFFKRRYGLSSMKARKIFRTYFLIYLPWLIFSIQGLALYSHRMNELKLWYFQWLSLLRQESAPLIIGFLFYSFSRWRDKQIQPVLLFCWMFLLTSCFLTPFVRYGVPFFPVVLVCGVCGIEMAANRIAQCFGRYRSAGSVIGWALILLFIWVPNRYAYGSFHVARAHLDSRDDVRLQEWPAIVDEIPSGKVATTNARSLLFYSNLKGIRKYSVVQFGDKAELSIVLERPEVDWIVVQKYPIYDEMIKLINEHPAFEIQKELDHTVVYKKDRTQRAE